MVLRTGFLYLAQNLQEAADSSAHSVVTSHLADAVRDAHKGTGNYAHYIDHTGDGKTGDVIYAVNGDTMSAPYAINSTSAKQTASVDVSKANKVIPVVSYKKQETAAATKEGATAVTSADGSVHLVESATPLEVIAIREAKADYEIKLIAPGKGSSAFYPAEVLKRDGPQVFKAGTHVYLNHPTFAEESARPEGDIRNLAGVLTADAQYIENHAKGAGLYGRMKVFADHGQLVEEKAPHVGMSIRAAGVAESGKTKEGVPVLAKLTSAESVDIVTKAGAGGMILTEAARHAANPNVEDGMTEDEKKELREAARIVREGRAREIATRALSDVSLIEAGKSRVIDSCLRAIPMKDGIVDEAKFVEAVKEEAKREGAYLASLLGTGVRGMGAAPAVQLSEAEQKAQRRTEKRMLKESVDVFADLMGNQDAAQIAARGRAA